VVSKNFGQKLLKSANPFSGYDW